MSGPKGISYTVEQLAAMREASALAYEQSRLRVAEQERRELEQESSLLADAYGESVNLEPAEQANGREDSTTLRARVDRIQSATARGRRRVVQARDVARQTRLLDRLRSLEDDEPAVADPKRADKAAASPATTPLAVPVITQADVLARVVSYLSALEPGAELSEEFMQLAQSLSQAKEEAGASSFLRALQAEVARLNRAERERLRITALLRELDVRVGVLGIKAAEVKALVAAGVSAVRTRGDIDLRTVTEAVERAERIDKKARDRAYVAANLREILGSLGYQDVGGFDTVVPQNGQLVRKPGWSQHGLLVNVTEEEITLAVVRTTTEADQALALARDLETENDMCDDLPDLLEDIGDKGINPGRIRRIPAGAMRVRVLAGAQTAEQTMSTSRRTRPLQRER